jgi:hypothetical protein
MQTSVQAGGTLWHDRSAASHADLTGGRGCPAGRTGRGSAYGGGTGRGSAYGGGTTGRGSPHGGGTRCGSPHGGGPDSAHGRLLLLPAADSLLPAADSLLPAADGLLPTDMLSTVRLAQRFVWTMGLGVQQRLQRLRYCQWLLRTGHLRRSQRGDRYP